MSAGLGVAFALLWVSGVFFGMGIEQKLLEPRRRRKQANDGNSSGENPLPMLDEKTTYCTDGLCCPVPAVVAHYKRRFGVDIFTLPPAYDRFCNERADSQVQTPNVLELSTLSPEGRRVCSDDGLDGRGVGDL